MTTQTEHGSKEFKNQLSLYNQLSDQHRGVNARAKQTSSNSVSKATVVYDEFKYFTSSATKQQPSHVLVSTNRLNEGGQQPGVRLFSNEGQ